MLLANISHDLKTPITSIKGYVEGIQDGIADTPEKMKRYLDTIHTKAEVIDDLVNNLSVFSKLELSRLIFEFKEGDINLFMRDFVDDYRLDLEKNGINLETDIPTDEVIAYIHVHTAVTAHCTDGKRRIILTSVLHRIVYQIRKYSAHFLIIHSHDNFIDRNRRK